MRIHTKVLKHCLANKSADIYKATLLIHKYLTKMIHVIMLQPESLEHQVMMAAVAVVIANQDRAV